MFYAMYLSSVCQRRSWPDPLYEHSSDPRGYLCKVRVNNREYSTDVPYASEALARDGAAMKAYMICRNFSHNDGMYPGQRPGQSSSTGVIQGRPIAIGSGRRSNRSSAGSTFTDSSISDGSSGGNSPKSVESGFERHMMHPMNAPTMRPSQPTLSVAPAPSSRRSAYRTNVAQVPAPRMIDEYICLCGQDRVLRYGRCHACCLNNGWI